MPIAGYIAVGPDYTFVSVRPHICNFRLYFVLGGLN